MSKLTGQDAQAAIAVGQVTWNAMMQLDSSDVASLYTDDARDPDSVYHHLSSALGAVMRQLGLNEDEARELLDGSHNMRWVYNERTGDGS